jgi:site-specific DNA-methyltransferase (adenine-specific)
MGDDGCEIWGSQRKTCYAVKAGQLQDSADRAALGSPFLFSRSQAWRRQEDPCGVELYLGECEEVTERLKPASVDLVVTSPPYAQQRRRQYGGVPEDEYPGWTADWMAKVRRLLKPTGSVAIVIRTHVTRGRISPYVLRTRLKLHECGWDEPEEMIWIKPGSPPVGHKRRLRRSWENLLWFCQRDQGNKIYCDARANGLPSEQIGMHVKKGLGDVWERLQTSPHRGIARSPDYVAVSTAANGREPFNTHPAQFPVPLAEWLIRMLCPPGGLVLDPFVGSGSTCLAARNVCRRAIGVDRSAEYLEIARRRLETQREYHRGRTPVDGHPRGRDFRATEPGGPVA